MSVTAACIDVTGGRAMDIAYVCDQRLRFATVTSVPSFRKWVSEQKATIIAVDAPSKRNTGQVALSRSQHGIRDGKYGNFRVAEAILRQRGIGLYNTPQDKPPEWMERGWEVYEMLTALGYNLLDEPGRTSVIEGANTVVEVHPHASFVVGLGWIPQTKQNLAGQFERLAYLRNECAELQIDCCETFMGTDLLQSLHELDVTWDQILLHGIRLPEISHDRLDAVVGLTTAIRAIRGEAFAVGQTSDGVIVVPRELSPTSYKVRDAA
jgi:predicted nuclease with RNAse H fold